jgi:L-iditol 2-dehydrogenase
VRRLDLAAAEHVVIIGDGPIALLFLQVARLRTDAPILVAGHHDDRLDLARRLGADATTMHGGEALLADVTSFTGGALASTVVECVGSPQSWESAARLVAPAGTVLMFGGRAPGERASLDAYRLHYEEVDVIGAFHYGRSDVREAFGLLAAREVRIDPLITHRVPLGRFRDALDLALSRKALKVAVEPGTVP